MNYAKRKEASGAIRSLRINKNTIYARGTNRFSMPDSTRNYRVNQCCHCGSEDLRFAEQGYCLRCIQQMEFFIREHPEALAKLKDKFQKGGQL